MIDQNEDDKARVYGGGIEDKRKKKIRWSTGKKKKN